MPAQTEITRLAHESPAQAREAIFTAATSVGGSRKDTAAKLGVDVATLVRAMRLLGLKTDDLPGKVKQPDEIRELMLEALKACNGERKLAYAMIGMSQTTWRRHVHALDLVSTIEALYPGTEGGGGVHGAAHLRKLRKNAAKARKHVEHPAQRSIVDAGHTPVPHPVGDEVLLAVNVEACGIVGFFSDLLALTINPHRRQRIADVVRKARLHNGILYFPDVLFREHAGAADQEAQQ